MVAPPDRVYRAGVAVFGRRTPPFLQQIASCKRLGGAELFEIPAANAHDLGFCKYGNFCGPSLPHRGAYNSRFAAETGVFADREFPRKRENDAVARFGALRSTARLPALPPCEARCGGFLVVFVYLQAPLAVICVANEWASCTMSCINAAFGRTAGRARATTRGNETNAAVKRNRCGGRNAEHSRL